MNIPVKIPEKKTEKKQVAILAGGLGTRLRPITETVPKPLVPVASQPFLHWQILDLKQQGYTRILLLVSYLGEKIVEYFGDGSKWGVQISYAHETEPLGTGGALQNALPQLDESFFVLNGDSFLQAPLDNMAQAFDSAQCAALFSVYSHPERTPVPANVRLTAGQEALRKVQAYQKGAGQAAGFEYVESGIYLFHKSLWAGLPMEKFQIERFWPTLIEQKKLSAFLVPERFYDIGTPERLQEFEEKIRDYFPNTLSH